MAIDQRRAKRKTTTLPGITGSDGHHARLSTEGGGEGGGEGNTEDE
jgi:hypothetical protein